MLIIWNSILQARQEFAKNRANSVVTIGNFDGVHRGHQRIIKRTVQLAHELNLLSVVLSFSNHSDTVVGESPLLINTSKIRHQLLADQGIDLLLEVEFNPQLAMLEPDIFFQTWLLDSLRMKQIIVGYDFRFGYQGKGDFELLKKLCYEYGVVFERISPEKEAGEVISSSKIRQLLAEGRLEQANKMLGYNFVIEGEVIKGEQRGRQLGYPTANIQLGPEYLLPCYGVYLVKLKLNATSYYGLANVGIKPTFGKYFPLVEVYLLDIEIDLYGKNVQVEFLQFIRPENHFAGPEALKRQIEWDLKAARKMIGAEIN